MQTAALLIFLLVLAQFVPVISSAENHQSGKVHRHRRHFRHHRDTSYLETTKRKRCGAQLLDGVLDACKDTCSPGSDINISTICCSDQCDYRDIRKACCPDNK